jgi:hypothetical protein
MNELKNVLCPVPDCGLELTDAHALSSLATNGVKIEGVCIVHGKIQCRYKDGKLYAMNGIRPYQKLGRGKKTNPDKKS